MDVRDEFVPPEEFATVLNRVPQVCVEVVLAGERADAGRVLLAHRTNEPAKGEWFWPGGRLYKGEQLEVAARRVAREELGVEVTVEGRVGVYGHFWDTSRIDGVDARHTVNVVFRVARVDPDAAIELDDQHDDYRFVAGDEEGLHEYVREYLVDMGLRERASE
ncbi:NUDIX domain-containing protein [Halosimplex litoreum]|uniref:NUDIX domain-containing protein n=1 Tax=Halosimplex litoreum TaxID=1198301 RepID=A0A7T3KWF0_9EURY|nr:NUDIX domain-containing protein [Halosimplex litoreum]QPV64319.1 NUDIX domain-containing protein [Halosimplex litoreum]